MIRIIIADDQTLFRRMLEVIIQEDIDFDLIGSAANGQEALDQTLLHKPDILLLDIQMPTLSGIDVLKTIKEKLPKVKVVLLTTFEEANNIRIAFNYEADGYLVKDMKPEVLLMAVKCIYHDLVVMHSSAYQVLNKDKHLSQYIVEEKMKFGDMVFERNDLIIIRQIVEGKTNKEIAKLLNYSEGTVKNKVSNILTMTGLPDRGQIALFAIKNRIV